MIVQWLDSKIQQNYNLSTCSSNYNHCIGTLMLYFIQCKSAANWLNLYWFYNILVKYTTVVFGIFFCYGWNSMTDWSQSFNTLPFGDPCCLNIGMYTQIAITNISVCSDYANGGDIYYRSEVQFTVSTVYLFNRISSGWKWCGTKVMMCN